MSFLLNPFVFGGLGDMEHIATVTVGAGGAASMEFTSIPATFKHLQVRWIARIDRVATMGALRLALNGNTTAANYSYHRLYGGGASAGADGAGSHANYVLIDRATGSTASASIFGAGVVDILDYANTSKNTTVRAFGGADLNGSGEIYVASGGFFQTAAITSLTLDPLDTPRTFQQHSTAALYGIRG